MRAPAVLAVEVALVTEVQAGPKMKAGIGYRREPQRALGAVGHREVQYPAEEPPVVVAKPQLRDASGERPSLTGRELLAALELDRTPVPRVAGLVVDMDAVA